MGDQKDLYTKNVQKRYGGKITLYQLSNNTKQTWYYRFKSPIRPSRYVRKSTKETDQDLALRVAIDAYEEMLFKSKLGLIAPRTTINLLVERFLHGLKKSSHIPVKNILKNYWWMYFKDDDLYNMPDDAFHRYIVWRTDPKNYALNRRRGTKTHNIGIHAVSKATIQHESDYLRFFLRRGVESALLLKMPSTSIIYENFENISIQPTNRRRGRFTRDQLKVIADWRRGFAQSWRSTIEREKQGKDATHDDFNGHGITRFSNATFYMIISLIYQTGIRPVECKKLLWSDINRLDEDGETYCWIRIRKEVSKVRKEREAICSNMEAMLDHFNKFKYEWEKRHGYAPSDNDYIFTHPTDPKRFRDFTRMFKIQLERLSERTGCILHGGFIEDDNFPDGKAWKQNTLYSFRSAYITNQLRHQTSIYHLSVQCGVSIDEITKTYNVNTNLIHKKYFTAHIRRLRNRANS